VSDGWALQCLRECPKQSLDALPCFQSGVCAERWGRRAARPHRSHSEKAHREYAAHSSFPLLNEVSQATVGSAVSLRRSGAVTNRSYVLFPPR
jgi:hypothetical protein